MELPKPQFQMEYPKLKEPKKRSGFKFPLLFLILIAFLGGAVGGIFISTYYYKEIEKDLFANRF
jgi:hypothetical protein